MVEFALVFPIFILLIVGLIEFAFAFNALLSVNFASRDAALLAAEAGEDSGSDCVVLLEHRRGRAAPGLAGADLSGPHLLGRQPGAQSWEPRCTTGPAR